MEKIEKFININCKMFKKEKLNKIHQAYILLLVMVLCSLPFTGSVSGVIGSIVFIFFSLLYSFIHVKWLKIYILLKRCLQRLL